MNWLPISKEKASRRPNWVEGNWVVLADGESWSFPPPEVIPGYQEKALGMAREVVDSLLPLLNVDAIRRSGLAATAGDPSALLRTLGQMFAMYQIVFRAGSALLKRNYDLADSYCDVLMPFNYQVADLADPLSKIHQTTPEILAICNAVAKISGVDIGPEMARIASCN